jgi:hypothetical protein
MAAALRVLDQIGQRWLALVDVFRTNHYEDIMGLQAQMEAIRHLAA